MLWHRVALKMVDLVPFPGTSQCSSGMLSLLPIRLQHENWCLGGVQSRTAFAQASRRSHGAHRVMYD